MEYIYIYITFYLFTNSIIITHNIFIKFDYMSKDGNYKIILHTKIMGF